jgi:selenocysteine-specific elongation factor
MLAAEGGQLGLPRAALPARLGLLSDDGRAIVERMAARGELAAIGAVFVTPAHLEALSRRVAELAEAYHREHPMEDGIPREEARVRACPRAAAGVFERVLDDLVRQGAVTATDRIGVRRRRAEDGGAEAAAREAVAAHYHEAGLQPPDQSAVAEAVGLPAALVSTIVTWLVRQKTLVRVDALVFHEAVLRRLKDQVRALKHASPGRAVTLDVAAFKERYGMTRKYAIPLLEYLDRERVTRRVGDSRIVI